MAPMSGKSYKLHTSLILVLGILLIGFNVHANTTEYLIASDGTLNWLGMGFDSTTRYKKEACISGVQTSTGNHSMDLGFYHGLDFNSILQNSYGRTSVGVNFIIFGGSASITVTQRYSETSSRMSSFLRLNYIKHRISLENRSYTDLGLSVLNSLPKKQREICGDRFIHSAKLGASLTLAANLEFKTMEDYKKYVKKIKVRFLFWSKTITEINEFKREAEGGVFSLKLIQNGGYSARLEEIMTQNPTYCLVENIEACMTTSDLLFDYIFSPDGYTTDVDNNLAILDFTTEPYIESGHLQLKGQTTNVDDPGYSKVEAELMAYLGENVQNAEKIRNILLTDGIDPEEYNKKLDTANHNIAILEAAIAICKNSENYDNCQENADIAIASLESIVF